MARSGSRRKRRANGRRGGHGASGAVLVMAFVLAGAAAVAWYYRADLGLGATVGSEPAPAEKPAEKPAPAKAAAPEPPPADESGRFEFYDMLPDAEVEVAEQPKTPGSSQPPLVSVPGTYVVQAGAFPNFAEADKVKARLALLGIASEIQAADANGKRFHRVRIGPLDDLDDLNRLRARLRQNGIEYLVIPIGE